MKILGVIGGVGGALIMVVAGTDMMRIQSEAVAGRNAPAIAEVFYNALGLGFIGLGIFCIMLICVIGLRGVRPAEASKEEDSEEESSEDDDSEGDDSEEKDSDKHRFLRYMSGN